MYFHQHIICLASYISKQFVIDIWVKRMGSSEFGSRGLFSIKRRNGSEAFIEEEDHKSHEEENKISEDKAYSFFFSGGISGETATVQIHSSYDINGDGKKENDQKERDQKGGAFCEYPENQKESSQKFNPGESHRKDVYQKAGQNFVIINDFGELIRMSDLI